MANFGCSWVAAESRRLAPKFLSACGIADHLLFFVFFSGLIFSSYASKGFTAGWVGVAGVAENVGVGDVIEKVDVVVAEKARFSEVIGVGGPTSSSAKRLYTISFSMFSPATVLGAMPDIGREKFIG
jgi:hypothetical protein